MRTAPPPPSPLEPHKPFWGLTFGRPQNVGVAEPPHKDHPPEAIEGRGAAAEVLRGDVPHLWGTAGSGLWGRDVGGGLWGNAAEGEPRNGILNGDGMGIKMGIPMGTNMAPNGIQDGAQWESQWEPI